MPATLLPLLLALASAAPSLPPVLQTQALHISGLPDVRARAKGSLTLTSQDLVFTANAVDSQIPLDHIVAVSVGNERVEIGGTKARIARMAIPFGGGPALGALTSKSVDLFTVEYRDPHQGYHGAVFILPTREAAEFQSHLVSSTAVPPVALPVPCTAAVKSHAVLFAPIRSTVPLPTEYRALVYEQLLSELRRSSPSESYIRAGDVASGPGCEALTLNLVVDAFRKGNVTERAASGPLGLFVGTTSIEFHVQLQDTKGTTLFETRVKKTIRGESESLDVTRNVAKLICKRIDKELARPGNVSPALSKPHAAA